MKNSKFWLVLSVAGLLAAPIAYAEDSTMDEDSVTVADEGESAETVTNRIALPDAASDTARENAEFGHSVANQAREMGREFGQQRAAEARADAQSNQRAGAAGAQGRP